MKRVVKATTKTSLVKTSRSHTFSSALKNNNRGFSLIEILVTIALASVATASLVSYMSQGGTERLEDLEKALGRAIKVASDRAIFANSLVRIRFDLEREPQQIVIEESKDPHLKIMKAKDASNMYASEIEAYREQQKRFSSQFSQIDGWEESPFTLPEGVYILGIASDRTQRFAQQGTPALYFRPDGLKDAGLILGVVDGESLLSIELQSFLPQNTISYHEVTDELENSPQVERLVQEWLRVQKDES